ncbi:MAG: hypothetical protein KBI47_18145 [Armatimonadetes bacterium]|nr:hypothetical protein [Armatimonadota bacterium]
MKFDEWIQAVGEMSEAGGEAAPIAGYVCGEMAVSEIPLNPNIDVAALKAGDPEPLETVVAVPATKSRRGWRYTSESLKNIVDATMTQGLPGFLGHQKPENVESEFPTPVTHWVGAKFDDNAEIKNAKGEIVGKGIAYFRGVVDQAANDLKRWIKAGTIKTVSIFGVPKLQQVGGETYVVGYQPLSIDWTPLGRAGMPTAIVALGEMDDPAGELDGSHEELRDAIRAAARATLGDSAWVRRVYDSYAIIEEETKTEGVKLWRIPYGVVDDKVQLGAKTEVQEVKNYVPVTGEIDTGGGEKLTWKELIAQLKPMLDSKEVTLGQVIGEMGLTAQAVAGEMADVKTAMDAAATLAQVREALGVSGEMDVVQTAKTAAEAVTAQAQATHDAMVTGVLAEKVKGEMAQDLVRRILVVPVGATKEQVAGEIDKLLGDDKIKAALSKLYTDQPVPVGGGGSQQPTSLRTKRQAI